MVLWAEKSKPGKANVTSKHRNTVVNDLRFVLCDSLTVVTQGSESTDSVWADICMKPMGYQSLLLVSNAYCEHVTARAM